MVRYGYIWLYMNCFIGSKKIKGEPQELVKKLQTN